MPDVRKAGLGVEVLALSPGEEVVEGGAVEPMPLEGALGPVPRVVFLGAEGQDLGGALKPQWVDQVQGDFVLIVLDGEVGGWRLDGCWWVNACCRDQSLKLLARYLHRLSCTRAA